ncbi:MAG TPA: sugar transferase [Terriglobales bacterium]|nr:sugar transferase [Terriglobales bacterium]
MLRSERKRTDRSGKPFVLMLLDGTEIFQSEIRHSTLQRMVSTLEATVRETDTYGWYQNGAVIGVLFTEMGNVEAATAADTIVDKVTGALRDGLGSALFKEIAVTIHVFPDGTHKKASHSEPHRHNEEDKFYTEFAQPHRSQRFGGIMKRSVDLIGSLCAIAVLSPVFLIIAALVKLTSKGPVLFRQRRIGQYGQSFTFLKFRSMYTNADSKIHQEYVSKLISGKGDLNQGSSKEGVTYKLMNDPRITPLGRFLRRTSLDELPQFFNVLKGEMSLVGPRPPIPYEFECYDLWHRRRVMEVKPGITGLWQVMGRSRTSFDEMVRLDLKYARAWSIWLDLKILWQTPRAVFSGDGAY